MTRSKRITAVYRKELKEILRDRRTIMAMIVIPVVLYPLMMIGFASATERAQVQVESETFKVEVADERMLVDLTKMLTSVDQLAESNGFDSHQFEVRVGTTPLSALGDDVQLRVELPSLAETFESDARLDVVVHYSEVNVHSRTAMSQLRETLDTYSHSVTYSRVYNAVERAQGSPPESLHVETILKPVEVEARSAATERQRGGWALGKIVPLILVLMTITGAMYPAIDLTAGERERGTLETLMVSPVPILDVVIGKFLVVATMGMMAAVLNVASVGATMHFGGMTRALLADAPIEFPLSALPIVLLCMIPLTMLFSAILLAVCSFARTFKEAQNYLMPVMIMVIVPAMAMMMPNVRLQGILMVIPVGNMVLLARDLFQQNENMLPAIIVVLLSTSLYAAAAIAVATRLFGQEAVLFVDAGSYKTLFQRRHFRPSLRPSSAQALMLAALLFPAAFYANGLARGDDLDIVRMLGFLAVVQFLGLFILLPTGLAAYLKINVPTTFSLRLPRPRFIIAALLLGLSTWALAYESVLLQKDILPPSAASLEQGKIMEEQLAQAPFGLALLLLAIAPGIAEEWLFRGFVLGGLRSTMPKWAAIFAVAAVFAVYHSSIERLFVTGMLGLMLGYLCWQSGSIIPGILAHVAHNAVSLCLVSVPWIGNQLERVGVSETNPHLPGYVIGVAVVLTIAGLAFASGSPKTVTENTV